MTGNQEHAKGAKTTGNLVVQCPICRRPVPWQEDYPHRPFCSARCKQIDFGDWILEKHAIAGETLDDWQGDGQN